MSEIRCISPVCIVKPDGVRGRMFTPPKDAKGMATVWCPQCLAVANQMTFFSHQTADMIRKTYHSYVVTNLPKEVKVFLKAYTQELIEQLGEDLNNG